MWRRLGTIFVLRNVRVLRGQILAERFRTWWRSGHGDRELFVCFVFFPLNLLEFEKNGLKLLLKTKKRGSTELTLLPSCLF